MLKFICVLALANLGLATNAMAKSKESLSRSQVIAGSEKSVDVNIEYDESIKAEATNAYIFSTTYDGSVMISW
jgi:hypothetical protein